MYETSTALDPVAMIATKSRNKFNEISKDSLSPLPVNGKTIIFKM